MINQRTEFVLKSLLEGVNFTTLCAETGISRRVGYKWKARFLREGISGMAELSRRPIKQTSQLAEDVTLEIVRLHQAHAAWGPKKIRELYLRAHGSAPAESSFKRIFEKAGWVKKRKIRSHLQSGRIHSGRRAEAPNEVWSVDFKGWWRTQDGERCEPLTVRDEYSRYVLEVRSMESARIGAVRAVFEQLFERHGLPVAIRSDNGTPFAVAHAVLGLSRLSAWWVALGIDLERGRPGKPQDNGAHERMHKDISEQLQACAREDLESQQAAFDVWRNTFNQERPHEALGMKTPSEVYGKNPRRYEGTPEDLSYPGMQKRRVQNNGTIRMNMEMISISSALAGWSVGLKEAGDETYEVYFANLCIGRLDPKRSHFERTVSEPREKGPKVKRNNP